MYWITVVSTTFKLIIYVSIVSPGHGKCSVNGLNISNKTFLREKWKNCQKILPQPQTFLGWLILGF